MKYKLKWADFVQNETNLKLFKVEQLGIYKFVFEVSLNFSIEMNNAFAEILDNNDVIANRNQLVGTQGLPLL